MNGILRLSARDKELTVYLEPIPFEFSIKGGQVADIEYEIGEGHNILDLEHGDNDLIVSGQVISIFVDGENIYR